MPAFTNRWRFICLSSYILILGQLWMSAGYKQLFVTYPLKYKYLDCPKIPSTIYAGEDLKNSDGSPIEVVMIDNKIGFHVSEGLESSHGVTTMVLEGNSRNWIEVKPQDGKPPLLVGCLIVTLKEGKGRLDNLPIIDNSSFVCDKKFRFGFKTPLDSNIEWALLETICMKDARGKSNAKKEIPKENDALDVLVNIAKNAAPLRNPSSRGFKTFKQLLDAYKEDPEQLRDVNRSMQFVLIFSRLIHMQLTA
ncbi:unnamed protein product [Sphagnum balticum]